MPIHDTRTLEQIRQRVEQDLAEQIKDLKGLQDRADKIKWAMALIKAALVDSGHPNLATFIENHVNKL